jgi:hypothetical protein
MESFRSEAGRILLSSENGLETQGRADTKTYLREVNRVGYGLLTIAKSESEKQRKLQWKLPRKLERRWSRR